MTRTQIPREPAPRSRGGRFAIGASGNPSGRPKSESAELRRSLLEGAADVVTAILKAAKAGDMMAAKIVLDRLLPPLKATAQAVTLDLHAGASPLDIARGLLSATAAGTIPPDVAAQLVAAIGNFCRIEEIEELRDRIAALEKATANQKPKP